MKKLLLLIASGLIIPIFSGSTFAWTYTASGPWASFNFGAWTVYQNEWGSPDVYCELYANSASNWASAGSWTGSGTKGYPHVQGNPNLTIGSYWCNASFNFSGLSGATYTLVFDCWTAGMKDEIMIEEAWGGPKGTWGTQIASNVTIGGRLYASVWQAHNGSNPVFIFTPASQKTSGTTDIMAVFVWCQGRGLLQNNTLYEVSFGPEITATNGWQQFTMNSFSCSWGSNSCTPTAITPYIQVNGGSWQQTSSVTVKAGSSVKFGPQPVSGGSWSWTGCGTSGTSREQTFTANSSCTATATYTNPSGCQSTQNFNVTVSSGSNYVGIQNKATGLLIDGMGRTSNGSNAGQWSSSGSSNQKWIMETSGSNVKFKNVATGLYLDGMGRNSNGSLAGQWSNSSSSNQQWTIETFGNYKRIKNVATGLYLDGMYWSSNGSDLGQWSSSGSDAQQWTITTLKSAETSVEGIYITEDDIEVHFFPNPFTSEINLTINNPDEINKVVIFDFIGKIVETVEKPAITRLLCIGSSLQSGMYIVKVYGTYKSVSYKVIKM